MQLIHGDCLEKMKDIADKSIDMILCDLPYGTTACKWDVVIPFEPLWEQYKRIIKDRGAIVLFGSEPFSSYLRMSNIEWYKYDWYWKKSHFSNFFQAKFRPLNNIELISVFGTFGLNNGTKLRGTYNLHEAHVINKVTTNGGSGKIGKEHRSSITAGNIFTQEYTNMPSVILEYKRDSNTVHPTQKPLALLEFLVKTYTLEGETVLDNCIGSGTTGIACINTKRNFIGIEKDDKYFEIAKKRIEEHLTTDST